MKKSAVVLVILAVLLVGGVAVYRRAMKPAPSVSLGELPMQTSEEPSGGSTDDTDTNDISAPPVDSGTTPVPPEVTMTLLAPTNNSTFTTPTVTVKGKTIPNAEVFVNEGETKSDASGNFSFQVTLDEGENIIVVLVNDAEGNMAEQELTLTYQPK